MIFGARVSKFCLSIAHSTPRILARCAIQMRANREAPMQRQDLKFFRPAHKKFANGYFLFKKEPNITSIDWNIEQDSNIVNNFSLK